MCKISKFFILFSFLIHGGNNKIHIVQSNSNNIINASLLATTMQMLYISYYSLMVVTKAPLKNTRLKLILSLNFAALRWQ